MKNIYIFLFAATACCITLKTGAQDNIHLQKLPTLNATEFIVIENEQSTRIKREAGSRIAGQHNVIILSGNNAAKKQNAARWLAQKINVPIYKVDLSLIVNKNFTKTKNALHNIFESAKNKNWVLFFDEGDALFGKRSPVGDSHDRYDNETTNYFISQVEKYRGSIIISVTASNDINPFIFEKFIRFNIH